MVGVVPPAAQVVLDHGLLHVHPLHVSPGAAARVQQAAQALGQGRQTVDAGHAARPGPTVRRFTVHSVHKKAGCVCAGGGAKKAT